MSEVLDRPTIALHGITTVAGRYVIGPQPALAGINLFACRLRTIGSDNLRVTAPVIPEFGEAVSFNFSRFGELGGRVRRQYQDGFEIDIDQTAARRDRLNDAITSFSERLWTAAADRRKVERSLPSNPRTVIGRPDNWHQPCLIIDYSAEGVAVSGAFQPVVGEVVTVGQVTGEVVRVFDIGFAVRFFERQDPDLVEGLLEAATDWHAAIHHAGAPGPDEAMPHMH
ncbi:hypothetical protein ACFOOL_14085 [Devosia honganensis]|uniref:PilZ domain-containing protein n=1 Tax=Devosia honganensis TaxID=1610527 RepID=A0ABV7X421_9HYPH